MASKIDADWTKELSLKGENCPKHSGFTLDIVCKECKRNVCAYCAAFDHPGHDIERLRAKTEQISELKEILEKRKRELKIRIKNCQEMMQKVHETSAEKLCSIDRDRDRRKSSVEVERSDFERRAKSMLECLEEEENKMYALEYSLDAALSRKQESGEENTLSDIQEKLEKCTSAQLPRVKTYNNLTVKFERIQSPNRFSSSSTTTLGELASSPVFEPSTSTCRRWPSETSRMRATRGCDTEQLWGAAEMEHSEDASDLQGDMDTGSGSDCEELGAEGGLSFKIDREGVIKGQMKENEKVNDAHSQRDDVVLFDLAMQLLPDHLTPLGLSLGVSNTIINQIRFNNPLSIGNAI
eukprot:XP_011681455.1 PREDICTED: uncharacterized protein LOC105446393 [Strongylocentrotus purpuratus]